MDTLEDIRNQALNQYETTGQIDADLLDYFIEEWGIELYRFPDRIKAKETWRRLIFLSLTDPPAFNEGLKNLATEAAARCEQREHRKASLLGHDNQQPNSGDYLPDIVA